MLADEALRLLDRTGGECFVRSRVLYVKGLARWIQGSGAECDRLTRAALSMQRGINGVFQTAHCLDTLSWVAAADRRPARAAWLLGAADAVWSNIGTALFGVAALIEQHDRAEAAAKSALGQDAYARLYRQGRALPLEQAVELALADADTPEPDSKPETRRQNRPDELTRREREVAALVAEGLSNREIAERLAISKRTADAHVEHILAKLRISSRSERV